METPLNQSCYEYLVQNSSRIGDFVALTGTCGNVRISRFLKDVDLVAAYLSAAGVKHLLYIPNKWSNHMFKDDCLYISYNAPIVPNADSRSFERYTGYDEYIYGGAIVRFLKAAEK